MTSCRPTGIPKPAQIGLLLAGTAAAVVTGRLLRKRSSGPAERLASALLDTTLLECARRDAHASPTSALASCAGYVAHLISASAADSGLPRSSENSAGSSCKITHPYSGAKASVFTQRTRPDESFLFSMEHIGICSVRGARTISPIRVSGITPSRNVRDLVQFDLGEAYTVQLESNLMVADFVTTGSNRVRGEITLDDACGNAGKLSVQPDGTVSGSLRNGGRVLGRFSGSVAGGIQFISFRSETEVNGEVRA